ncbi:MAG: autotransporter outer membrane beta-barrel domain-containing protein [Rhodanobacteraceae bacterium]
MESFAESGSLTPLRFPGQSEDSRQSALGLRVSRTCEVGRLAVRPEVRAAWQHQSGDRRYAIDSQFASGAGDAFTVFGPKTGRDAALISGGAAVIWSEHLSTSINYDGLLGRSNHEGHNVSGSVTFVF